MTLSMYQASLPVLAHQLRNLAAILDKGLAHANARGIAPEVLLNMRLAPDMFALTRQVQIATDVAKGCAARLAGQAPPSYADDEDSFEALQARIAKTLAFIGEFAAPQIDGSEQRAITLKLGEHTANFNGQDYLLSFVLPNFFFHVTTAYAILRHAGVDIGKRDFLGAIA